MNKTNNTKPSQTGRLNLKFIPVILCTVTGFITAIIANLFIPQISEKVVKKDYAIGGLTLNINSAYRLVLTAIILLYIGMRSL